jgi:hypothetical protein
MNEMINRKDKKYWENISTQGRNKGKIFKGISKSFGLLYYDQCY